MPNTGGVAITASTPGRHSARTTRSMPSSLPRPTSTRADGTSYNAASASTSAAGCGSG
jgi:hypothetical protein